MTNPNFPATFIEYDALIDLRYVLIEQLNIIKNQNRNPANRTLPRAITALIIYRRLEKVQAEIKEIEELEELKPIRLRLPIFFADGD